MMKEYKKIIKVKPTSEYPCQWDDLIDSRKKVIATIYTLEEGEKDNLKPGITKGEDGIYDIVVHAQQINNEVVKNALEDLGNITDKRYVFSGSISPEDEIIDYAKRLMKPLKKYGNPEEGYDFSKARTTKQKAEVVGIWIGEILYESLTYKDVESVRSLTETIIAEILVLAEQAVAREELINGKH